MSETPPPMTLGQILDRIFRLMRAYWRLFLGIGLPPAAAAGAIMTAAMAWWLIEMVPQFLADPSHVHFPILMAVLFWAGNLVPIPLFALYAPAGIHAAMQANLGVRARFRQAYSIAWRRYRQYLWLMVLLLAYVYVPVLVVGALIGGGALLMLHGAPAGAVPNGVFLLIPVGILAYFGLFVYWVLIMLRFALAYPACVAEDLTARAALGRSTTLTCGGRGRIFVVLLVVSVAAYAAVTLVMTLFEFVAGMIALGCAAAHVAAGSAAFYGWTGSGAVLFMLLMIVYSAFIYAALSTALAVIYHDQRWRKDRALLGALPN